MQWKRYGWLILALLAVALAACTNPGSSGVSGTAAPLTETFTSADGTVSFQYPSGWQVTERILQISIATSQEALEANSPTPGQFAARMLLGPAAAVSGLTTDSTPVEVVNQFITLLGEQDGTTFNPTSEITVGDRPAARVDGSAADGQGVLIAVNMGDGIYNIVSATSAPGELAQFEPTLLAILASVAYREPAVTPEAGS
jgi:hypothetical protein